MRYLKHILLLAALLLWGANQAIAAPPPACPDGEILILAPFVPGDNCLPIDGDNLLGTWLNYWGTAVQWALNLGLALTTLWVLFGGIRIMTAGGDSGAKGQGIAQMKQGLIGLLLFVFAGSILIFLNSMFFTVD